MSKIEELNGRLTDLKNTPLMLKAGKAEGLMGELIGLVETQQAEIEALFELVGVNGGA